MSTLPTDLAFGQAASAAFEAYVPLAEVARLLNRTPHHVWLVVTQHYGTSNGHAKQKRVSQKTLRTYPLEGWRQIGNRWELRADVLRRYLTPRVVVNRG